jgi:DNA transposition AAA+ family ATPase
MALSTKEKQRLAAIHVPNEEDTRQMIYRFMGATGLTQEDFAEELGYSGVSLSHFLLGRYDENCRRDDNTLRLRATVKDYIERHPAATESAITGRLYETEDYKQIRKYFYKALEGPRAYCVDGAPGTRKTHILKCLIRELQIADAAKNGHGRRAVYVRARMDIGPHDMMRRIALASGISARGRVDQLIRKIGFHFAHRRAVIVIDEAQLLSVKCLEGGLRDLLDEPPYISLILAGSHQVEDTFNALPMEQWRRRNRKTIKLQGLTHEDAANIITLELGPTPQKAIDRMIEKSTALDYRVVDENNKAMKYISAGLLFYAIEDIKSAKAQQATAAKAGIA